MRVGRIVRTATAYGFDLDHRDTADRLMRVVRVDLQDQPISGASRVDFTYDARGRLTSETFRDASGAICACDEGFAAKRLQYGASDGGGSFEETTHFGTEGAPVLASSGYCVERIEYDAKGRIQSIAFRGTAGERTGVLYRGATGVSDVEFAYLPSAAGQTVYLSLLGPRRELLHKERIGGTTGRSWRHTSTYTTTRAE